MRLCDAGTLTFTCTRLHARRLVVRVICANAPNRHRPTKKTGKANVVGDDAER